MSLSDDVNAGPPEAPRRRTKIDDWLDRLDAADREAAMRALSDPAWRHVDVHALLARHGLDVSDVQVWKYRRALNVAG